MKSREREEREVTELSGRNDLPIYPKYFIAAAHLNRERDRVFVAMPFEDPHSDEMWKIIESVCTIHDLNVRRGDSATLPTSIVSNILEELEMAEIIIADLTGLNPNVLYELGIAHVRCDSVVLLSPKGQQLPFNLSSIRCIFYLDLNTRKGRRDLATRLGNTLDALKKTDKPLVIESAEERTSMIIEDLQTLANLPNDELAKETILFSGFLSSFAISSDEPCPPGEESYQSLLVKEREILLSLARRGCTVKLMITPPTENNWKPYRIDTVLCRLRTLISLLESDETSVRNIEPAVSPFGQKNLYVIGHVSCSEGFKKGYQRGFGLTSRQTGYTAIHSARVLYESVFDWLVPDTLSTYGKKDQSGRRRALVSAATTCLEESLKFCEGLKRHEVNDD